MGNESNARSYVVAAMTVLVGILAEVWPAAEAVVKSNFEEIVLLILGLSIWFLRSGILKAQPAGSKTELGKLFKA